MAKTKMQWQKYGTDGGGSMRRALLGDMIMQSGD
jgi:hypothetical protein